MITNLLGMSIAVTIFALLGVVGCMLDKLLEKYMDKEAEKEW